MTAFAGIFSQDGEPVDRRQVEGLAASVPGTEGSVVEVWAEDAIALASAVARPPSTSEPETRPLRDDSSGCVIVFDGRIDNRDEVRGALREAHRPGRTAADAAIVLAAYVQWGTDAPARLLGDFAFAVWDPRGRRVVLARDPVGIRPVFFSQRGRRFVFASTLEQLLHHPDISGEIDDDAAVSYLYFPRLRLRRSFFRDSQPLFGGELAEVDERGLRIRRYWRWPSGPPPFRLATGEEREEFRGLFEDAIRSRLRSAQPVGIMLSGGLDSGSIASVAGHLQTTLPAVEVRTYSARFRRFRSSDESEYADAVIRRYGLQHAWIDGDECWPLSTLDRWLPAFTEPFFDAYPAVFRGLDLARRDGVRVVLTGYAGDAVLIGSPKYLGSWLLRGRWRELHGQLRALARVRRRGYGAQLAAHAVLPLLPTSVQEAIERRRRSLGELERWMPPRVRRRVPDERRRIVFGGPNGWWHALHNELVTTSDSPQHAYFDRSGRLFGIEIRQPMIDARLIEFALRTPPDAFHFEGRTRVVQREALADVLPPSVRDRETKSSALPLMAYGLRERRRSFVASLLRDSELERRGYVLPGTWTVAMERYLGGKDPLPSWFALTLEIWLRHREGRLPPIS